MSWIKSGNDLTKTINGREYLIRKTRAMYVVYCDGGPISNPVNTIAAALAAVSAHTRGIATLRDGIHIDAIAGQQLVDILKRSFTTARIQDFMDASPYDEPDTGAPEGGPLG